MIKKRRLFIEAGSLAEPKMSGVGNTTLNIVKFIAANPEILRYYKIYLLVPFNKTMYLDSHNIPDTTIVRKIYIPGKIINGMTRFGLMPPMDLIFGTGVYLFPNFKNWPLLFSKSITYVHDLAFLRYPNSIEKRNLSFLKKNMSLFLRRTTMVITVSKFSKDELLHFYKIPEKKIEVVYNGVDHERFFPRSLQDQISVAEKYGLSRKRYFMFLSNIEPRKNIMKLLEAFEIYHAQDEESQLLLVGGMSWGDEAIRHKIVSLNDKGVPVVLPDVFVPNEDIPALLSGAIGLVHPAIYEGFGLPPLEALACGINVAVARNTSLPEVVGDVAHFIEDEHSAASIADSLVWLFENRNVESSLGVEWSKRFDWSLTLVDLKKVIISILSDKKSAE